ncbi:hypothetical protein Ddc_12651 [Ditylenchus destructor]|nr:hypothetical protein Ddc_12651 [Ditylenchus destructor]
MNLAILLFLAIASAYFADVTCAPFSDHSHHAAIKNHAISLRKAVSMLNAPTTDNCLVGQADKLQECEASACLKLAEIMRDPNFRKDTRVVSQDLFDCMRKAIVESCGPDNATPMMKDLFQKAKTKEQFKNTDKCVAECLNLDAYVESGGEVSNIPVTPASNCVSPTIAPGNALSIAECPFNPSQVAKVDICYADFLVKSADLIRHPTDAKGCSMIQDLLDCTRKIIVESCGEEKATAAMKEVIRTEQLKGIDKSLPECKKMDYYIKNGKSGAATFSPTNIALTLSALAFGLSIGLGY